MRIVALLAGLIVLAAGCGGSTATSGSAAGEVAAIVPASAPLLLAVETDRNSEQWQQADELLAKFPGRGRVLDELRGALDDDGVDVDEFLAAVGDETYVAVLDFEDGDVVGITKPRDEAKFVELMRESDDPSETREVEGWTLVADSAAILDRFTASGERLEDADWFSAAQERVEDDALVTVFANGQAIGDALESSVPDDCEVPAEVGKLDYAVGTFAAEEDGVRLRLAAAGEGVESLAEGESLLSLVPAGAFAFLGSPGFDADRFPLGASIRCGLEAEELPDLEDMLGISYDDLFRLFSGGFGLYGRSGLVIPEVTLMLEPDDAEEAVRTLDTLAGKVGELGGPEVERGSVNGVETRELNLGPVAIRYGAKDGKLVVTTDAAGFEALAGGDKLEDDAAFEDARDAAGVGADDDVFAYFDLGRLVELVEDLAGLAEEPLPREVRENLEPLRGFVAWGDLGNPDDVELSAFLSIR